MKKYKIKLTEKLAYAGLNFGQTTVSMLVSTYILYYYTDILLLPAAAVSVLLFTVRVFDGAIDPFIGYYMDRRETKLGKYRGYPLYWCVPFCVCSCLLFYPFSGRKGIVLTVCYILYYLWSFSFSMMEESTLALSMTITTEPGQRQVLNTFKITASVLGTLTVSYGTLLLVDFLGGGDDPRGYGLTVALFAIICFFCTVIGVLSVRERGGAPTNSLRFHKCLQLVAGNKKLYLFLLMYLFHQMASNLKSQTAIYYMKYAVDRMDLLPVFLLVSRLSNLCAQPLIVIAAKRYKINRCMIMGYCAAGAGMLIVGISNASLFSLFLGSIVSGIGSAFPANLSLTYVADISDEISRKHQNSSFSAMIASFLSLSSKFGVAMGGGLVALMLHLTDYVPNVAQNRTAMRGIQFTYTGLTAVLYLAAGLFALLSYKTSHLKRN